MKKSVLTERMIQNQIMGWLKMNRERLNVHSFVVRSVGTYDAKLGHFRSHGAWFQRGCPDILVCRAGRFIGLEIKTKVGRLSEHQKLFHEDIRRAGGEVHVVRDVSDLEGIFK